LLRYRLLSSVDLVKACTEPKNCEAWEEFIRRFQPVIAAVVLRTARQWGEPHRHLIDDLIQETYVKLCEDHSRLLRSFTPRHPDSIYGFLKVLAANVVRDHYKAASAEKRGAGQADAVLELVQPAIPSVGGASFQNMEQTVLLQQIQEAMSRLPAGEEEERNRQIFWLYYRYGMSAGEIASLPCIALTTKGVESIIRRMTHMIRSHMLEARGSAESEGFRRVKSL